MAADRAGGNKSAFYVRRRRDPGFAAAWDAAIETSQAALAAREPKNERRVVWASAGGKPRLVTIKSAKRWTPTAEGVFLAHLAATSNVKASAAKAGFSTTIVYKRRMRQPAFREAWNEALEQGYARVEMLMVEEAGRPAVEPELDPEAANAPVDKELALNLLRLHRAAVKGGPAQRYDWRAKADDPEEMRASILRKIAAIKRAERRGL